MTPDSFSDGGSWTDPERAITRGQEMIAEGADVVDVGGESTRPGADPVDEAEERRRVLPVITALAGEIRISTDTRKPAVAEAAIEAGATLVNDVSASLWPVAAAGGAGWVAMHMRGEPRTMQRQPRYSDVVGEVRNFLLERAERARSAGVGEVWIDPGIGFGKTERHNLMLLRHLGDLVASGFPVLVGASRKAFLGALLDDAPTGDRLEGSLVAAVWASLQGASMVRVHDVAATVTAMVLAGEQPAVPA